MAKDKKNKDKKEKKKNKDRDRERSRDKKDKKKRDKKRSYSSSSNSSASSDSSSSSSREKNKKKDSKLKKKDRKQTKPQTKTSNNPYDFDKTIPKAVPGFPVVGIPTPGFSIPIMHPTPPPPMTAPSSGIMKPKTKEINIFKLLPKIPYGAVLFGKTLYSTEFMQQKAYNRLLKQMMEQIQVKVKEQNSKKAMAIVSKCTTQIQKIINAEQERKKTELQFENNSSKGFLSNQGNSSEENNRFTKLKNIYEQCFQA